MIGKKQKKKNEQESTNFNTTCSINKLVYIKLTVAAVHYTHSF